MHSLITLMKENQVKVKVYSFKFVQRFPVISVLVFLGINKTKDFQIFLHMYLYDKTDELIVFSMISSSRYRRIFSGVPTFNWHLCVMASLSPDLRPQ